LLPPPHRDFGAVPKHVAFDTAIAEDLARPILDAVRVGDKFAHNFWRYRELFYPICSEAEADLHRFAEVWGYLELFVCRKL
jgi:hypothetical protein